MNEQRRDSDLISQLVRQGIDWVGCDDKCILAPGDVVNKQGGYFKVFTPFRRAYLARLYQQPLMVNKVPAIAEYPEPDIKHAELWSDDCQFDYPKESSTEYAVESEQIIRQLRGFDQSCVVHYHHSRDFPCQAGTSRLSAYLAIGALSVRQCMARVMYQQSLPVTGGRETWQSELIWREFYQHLLHFEPKLCQGSSFVIWGDHLQWRNACAHITAWKEGKTGYPIVDAAMRQLNKTGWMHNRLRMIVASFLVKDLHVDWRIGERYFMSKLIDGDYASNNGGWQWCASTGCDGQPYFRIFNPVTQGEKFDPRGRFVLDWLPELLEVPEKLIHQPWKWANARALSYPAPIVDHKLAREITLEMYKKAKESVDDG